MRHAPDSRPARLSLALLLLSIAVGELMSAPPRAAADPLRWSRWQMPYPRTNHVTVIDPVRNRLIIGGGRSLGQVGASPAWTWLGDGSLSGYYPAAILDAPGDRMVEYNGTADGVFTNDTKELDLATNSMSGFPGGGLQSGALAFDSLRRRMIVLGNNDDSKVLDLATACRPTRPTWRWTVPGEQPHARAVWR